MPDDNKLIPLSTNYIWLNGQFIESHKAEIHVLTHSLHYSGGVFEGEKAVNGKIFALEKHTNRLFDSALQMKLYIPYTKAEIMDASVALLAKNNLMEAYIRPLVWRSSERLLVCPHNYETNIMIAAWNPQRNSENKVNNKDNTNFTLTVSKWIKPSPQMMPVQCKSSSQYAMMTVAGLEARQAGFSDALVLDVRGYIAECTSSNIFFIRDNTLITPTTINCLNGITRQTIIDIAIQSNINVLEKDITLEDLKLMSSAFTTGTAKGIKVVDSISFNGQIIKLVNDQIVETLQASYAKLLQNA